MPKIKLLFASFLSVGLAGCQTTQVGAPSSDFDGVYSWKKTCSDGEGRGLSSKWDGSQFIIKNGHVSNNRRGGGRYNVSSKSRVDSTGEIYIFGTRSSPSGRVGDFTIKGNLLNETPKFEISGGGRTVSGQLSGSHGFNVMHPCIVSMKLEEKISANQTSSGKKIKAGELLITSKNTTTVFELLANKGEIVPVKVVLNNSKELRRSGLAIVVPSSTPDMDDEEFYASKFRKLGLATAVIYGADPRFTSKFSARYTSDVIVRDVAEAINVISTKMGTPKNIFVIGSSTGSLGIFKLAWADLRAKYPQLKSVTAGFMVNAACPDSFLGKWDEGTPIYAMNGVDDDSTPASMCQTLESSGMVPGFKSLKYPGAHHFESPNYGPTERVDGMHILPTCSINYSRNLHTQVKRRDGSDNWNTEEKGFGDKLYKWLGKTCVRRGNLQGYNKNGSDLMWGDINKIVVFGGL